MGERGWGTIAEMVFVERGFRVGSKKGDRKECVRGEGKEFSLGSLLLMCCFYRSLVYVEGDCSMNKFQSKDGTAQTALSIVQRERTYYFLRNEAHS